MINATVLFGSNNAYNLQINNNTLCGDLLYILPLCINKSYLDIIYMIVNGHLIDGDDLNHLVQDFKVIDNQCTIHIILKPKDDLSVYDKFIYTRYKTYIENKYIDTSPGFLTSLRNSIANLIDVHIVIQNADLPNVIEDADSGDMTDTCVVCSIPLTLEDACSSIRKCGHLFHTECISQWLTMSSIKCPLCNIDVRI